MDCTVCANALDNVIYTGLHKPFRKVDRWSMHTSDAVRLVALLTIEMHVLVFHRAHTTIFTNRIFQRTASIVHSMYQVMGKKQG